MKLPELKEKLKSKYIVRVVAGVLTIALVGTGIGATAVFAEKDSTAVTAEADSTTDSSKDADDIADKLMDSVSLKDNDADKDESVYLISDANGNVNKTIVVDHLKNKDKKDTLEDASNLSDIENVKGKEKFTQSGDKLTWQAGGKGLATVDVTPFGADRFPVALGRLEMLECDDSMEKKSHLRTLQENQERSKFVLTTQTPHHIQRQ